MRTVMTRGDEAMAQESQNGSKAFEGLNERSIVEIFQVGERRILAAGAILPLREDPENPSIVLVVKGSVRLVAGSGSQARDLMKLREGDWGGHLPHLPVEADAVVADSDSEVVLMAVKALRTADPRLQLIIERKVASAALNGFQGAAALGDWQNQLSTLSRLIREEREKRCLQYEDSGLVSEVLDDVPKLPLYASSLAIRLRDKSLTMRESAELAQQDPSLVAAILRAANSTHYGLRGRVADTNQAVMLLGLNQVHQIVLDHALRATMPSNSEFGRLHDHSLIISRLSGELAVILGHENPPATATLGLLHDVGKSLKLLLALRQPKHRVLIGQLDHAQLGALLLRRWNLPHSIWQSLYYQDYAWFTPPMDLPKESREDIGVLHLAHICYNHFCEDDAERVHTPFRQEYWDFLRVPVASSSQLAEEVILPRLTGSPHSLPASMKSFLKDGTRRLRERMEIGFDG